MVGRKGVRSEGGKRDLGRGLWMMGDAHTNRTMQSTDGCVSNDNRTNKVSRSPFVVADMSVSKIVKFFYFLSNDGKTAYAYPLQECLGKKFQYEIKS